MLFFQMMSFMNEALDILLKKVDRISKTGEIVDFHRLLCNLTSLLDFVLEYYITHI